MMTKGSSLANGNFVPKGSSLANGNFVPKGSSLAKPHQDDICLLCSKKRHNYKVCFLCSYCDNYGHKEDKCPKKQQEVCLYCKKYHTLEECMEFRLSRCSRCSAVGKHLTFFCPERETVQMKT